MHGRQKVTKRNFIFFTKTILITGNSNWKADLSLNVTPITYLTIAILTILKVICALG